MNFRAAILALSTAVVSASIMPGADLAGYRRFRLGMSVADVAKQAGIAPSAKLISIRPERIEDLDWRISWAPPTLGVRPEPFRALQFRFFNNELFEIAVTYDRDQTSGLTESDMIEAISGVYGDSVKPFAAEITFNSGFSKTVKAIAQWDDAQYQVSLVRLPYEAGFGLAVSSKASQAKAELAMTESARLDSIDAPQREAALRASQIASAQAKEEKARSQNKPGFRP